MPTLPTTPSLTRSSSAWIVQAAPEAANLVQARVWKANCRVGKALGVVVSFWCTSSVDFTAGLNFFDWNALMRRTNILTREFLPSHPH